ncbi:SIMPL domain-containing protein, partial [Helicobacter baculiformis]
EYVCNNFACPYGKDHNEDFKRRAMQQAQQQANAYARGLGAKQGELININVTKEIWPWFWRVLGMKCVKVRGYARHIAH